MIYDISVDTSSLGTQDGYLDFQFNPGTSDAESATATVTDFQSDAVVVGSPVLSGDASGLLPGTLTLDNGTSFNDIFQEVTFGSGFSFQLTLSEPTLGQPGTSGSAFALSLYAGDGTTMLLTTDPNGSVSTINLNADGTTSAETFPQSATDDSPVAVNMPEPNAVPEPSSLALFCALPGILLMRRLRLGDRHN